MLTRFSKILAVFTGAVSILVLGIVWVATMVGGPNWQAEAKLASDFDFVKSDSIENPTWSAITRSEKRGADGRLARKTVAQGKAILPEAILAAREDLKKEQQEELAKLELDIPAVQSKISQASALITIDLDALKKREAALVAELEAIYADIDATTKEAITKSEEVKTIRGEVEKRRNDVFRLTNELESLRADRYRMVDQQKKLESLLVRLEGNTRLLERREAQLLAAGAKDPKGDEYVEDEAAPKENAAPQPPEKKPDDNPEEKKPEVNNPDDKKPEEKPPEEKKPE